MASEESNGAPPDHTRDNQDPLDFHDDSFHEHYTARQTTLRKEKLFTDVLLKSQHLAIPCHKLALASASPYFFRKFSSGEDLEIAELQGVSPLVLELIIDYIYTAKVVITVGNVKALMKASCELELTGLKKACDEYLAAGTEPTNAMGMVMLAKECRLDITLEKAMQCLTKKPDDVFRLALDSEYQALSEDVLVEWISADDLEVSDESVAFQIVEKWVSASQSRQTESCVSRVLACVRLGVCSAGFLVKTVSRSDLIKYKPCLEQFEQAKSYALLKTAGESLHDVEGLQVYPRDNFRPTLVVMGGGRDSLNKNLHCWSLKEGHGTWNDLTTIPDKQAGFTFDMNGCVVGDNIIITGGAINVFAYECTANAWQFCISTSEWKQLPSMHQARCCHAAVAVGEGIFVAGGFQTKSISTVELLDDTRHMWKNKANMPCALYHCHAFNIGIKVYVVSGNDQKTVQYDIVTNKWQELTGMPSRNVSCAMVCVRDKIYAVGGGAACKSYQYDTVTDIWSTLTIPEGVHWLSSAAYFGGQIIICGGQVFNNDLMMTEIGQYNTVTDTYSRYKVSLPKNLRSHCVFVIAPK